MLFILLNIWVITGEFKIQQYQDLVVDDLFLMMLVSIFITIPCCCSFCSFKIILKHPRFCWSIRSVGQLALYLNIIRGTNRDLVVYQKQECRKAQAAEIRSQGYFWSIFRRRSPAEQLMFQKSEPPRLRSHSRFWMRTSLKVRPGKRLLPKRRWQKIAPMLNTSAIGVLLVDMSLMLMISGATNPGVPHLTNRQLGSSATVANPKSTITGQFDSFLNMIFSGLRSRWITFFLAIQAIPRSSPLRTCLVSASENLCLVIILVQSWEPSTYSRMRQIELSDSNTPSIFMRLGWSNIRLIFISLIRAGLPFYWEQVAYLAKALMAKCFPSFNLYPRYTEAKFPLPTFLIALKLMLKPL